MPNESIYLSWPKADQDKLIRQIERAHERLGKSFKEATKWAARLVIKSVQASTKVAPKLRPIVKNPDTRAKTDKRFAPFGVYRYYEGQKVFTPIYRAGEYGAKVKYISKDKVLVKVGREWVERNAGTGEFDVAGLAQSKKRVIARRGLAKRFWAKSSGLLSYGGSVGTDVGTVGSVSVKGGEYNPTITVTNQLRHALASLREKGKTIDTAMQRAAEGMEFQISKKLDKAFEK